MHITYFILLEAALLASSLSLDAFTAGFAYGADKTKIPMLSVQIINLICSGVTGLSLFAGTILRPYISYNLTLAIAFTTLFIIGLVKVLDGATKTIIRKYNNINKKINGSLFNFKFVLYLYANPEAADIDSSKSISPSEAALLALSLSLDGVAVGFGAALVNINGLAVFLWSLITNALFLLLGHFIGSKVATKTKFDLSCLGGVVLIGLAILKIL